MEKNHFIAYPLRKKLLLLDFMLYRWYCYETRTCKSLDVFLDKINIVVMDKVLYLICLVSADERGNGLFAVFDDWYAGKTGPIPGELYSHKNKLYNFDYTDNRFKTRQDVTDNLKKFVYPYLYEQNIVGFQSFVTFMKESYPQECALIDEALPKVLEAPKLWSIILGRKTEELIAACSLLLWKNAVSCPESDKMSVGRLTDVLREKEFVLGSL